MLNGARVNDVDGAARHRRYVQSRRICSPVQGVGVGGGSVWILV